MSHKSELYAEAGVDYGILDGVKRLALQEAAKTSVNLRLAKEVPESRGESAYVVEFPDHYLVTTLECLGTKSIVAGQMYKLTGISFDHLVAIDTVAAAVNDVITSGAQPLTIQAYWGVGSAKWWSNEKRARKLITGWAEGCNWAGVSWGGGESPSLTGIILPDQIDLAASCNAVIKPKENLCLAEKIQAGDVILFVESNGIHANGLSLARKVADELPDNYLTQMPDGRMYGEALLDPTIIYTRFVRDLQRRGIKIHYMSNITGHGLRKVMRANRELTYVIESLPEVPPVLAFIQEKSGMSDEDAYATLNMGVGFAIFVLGEQADRAILTNRLSGAYRYKVVKAGYVEEGPKRVVIKPKNIIFDAESLQIR